MSRCKPTQPLLFSVFCISLSLPHFFCISLTLPYFVFISLPLPYFSALPCCCFFFRKVYIYVLYIVLWWNSKKQNYPKNFMFYFRKTIFCIIMLDIPLWTWFSALCMIMLQYLDVYIIFNSVCSQNWSTIRTIYRTALVNAYRKTSVFTPSRNVLTKIKLNLINNSNYVLILDTPSKTTWLTDFER